MEKQQQKENIDYFDFMMDGTILPSDPLKFIWFTYKNPLIFTLANHAHYTLLNGQFTLFDNEGILPYEHMQNLGEYGVDPESYRGATVYLDNNISIVIDDIDSVEWMSLFVDEKRLEIHPLEYGQRALFYRIDEELAGDESETDIAPDQTPASYTDEELREKVIGKWKWALYDEVVLSDLVEEFGIQVEESYIQITADRITYIVNGLPFSEAMEKVLPEEVLSYIIQA